ncbi:MAG: hypothetical protein HY326_05180 [Chloroflexi bacterium]|nr:hypothetical protein [Chloroflexota bacterium]
MNPQRAALFGAILLCCLALAGIMWISQASAQSSPHYNLSWGLVTSSGGTSQSSHYVVSDTGGQSAPGSSASGHYRLGSGFWYGQGIAAPGQYKVYLAFVLRRH